MKCAYCNCLDDKNKKEGCANGCLYYCKVKKEYIYMLIICNVITLKNLQEMKN